MPQNGSCARQRPWQEALSQLVGSQLFAQGKMQKAVLATFIMQSREHKEAVNNIVHPAVAADFEQSGLSWLESAIFFDSFFYRRTHIDKVVCVTAPLPTRLSRIMQRDHISRQKAQQWIDLQLPQDEIARQKRLRDMQRRLAAAVASD